MCKSDLKKMQEFDVENTHGRQRTAALHNLGCKVNAYETEAMRQMLEDAGYRIVPFAPGADVYVINTCSVTNIADRKSRQMLHRARKMNPDAAVVAVGCYVQTAEEKTGLAVEADIILGNNHRKELTEALDAYFAAFESKAHICEKSERAGSREPQPARITDLSRKAEYETLHISSTQEHTRAFVKVQDGCNQFCTYCIIPYARGRIRSRASENVIRELEDLAAHGIREVVLTGIHLSSYGKDAAESRPADENALLDLIRRCAAVEGIDRIRLGSLEPGIVTDDFAAGLAEIREICPHFHLSLQSGSDTVLRRMNRHYSSDEYAARCALLRKYFTQPALTTDVIVGFPGETEEEFEETQRFLQEIRFYETHIFKYSRREGTRAAAMDGQLPESIKSRRSSRLIGLGEENKAAFIRSWEGRECEALFEERILLDGKPYFSGYTREYIQTVIPADRDYTNRVVRGSFRIRGDGSPGFFTPLT